MTSIDAPRDEAYRERGGELHAADSLSVLHGDDVRSLLMAGRTFVMQVAHPAVGAGVWEHSAFREDPWGRLRAIDRSGQHMVHHGPEGAAAEGERLRRLHRGIEGRDSQGRPYHSLDPEVYGWVHMVFIDSTVTMNAQYGTPMTRREQERLFVEWRQAGRFLGLRDRDMPATLDDYWVRYHRAIETELEYNEVVDYILRAESMAKPPALAALPDALWELAWIPLGRATRQLTLGSLPPAYLAKIRAHQPWTARDEARMERFRRLVRATVPRLPARWRTLPTAHASGCPV